MIDTLSSAETTSVYIDRFGLMNIPQLFNDFKVHEKYFVHKVDLEFVPNQPVTVGGSVSMAPDYDPIDPVPHTMASLSAAHNFIRKPVTSGAICRMPNFKLPDGNYMRPALYTGPSDVDRNVCYGKFVANAVSSLSDGVEVGSLILHWDISFIVKQPNNTSVGTSFGDKSIYIEYDSAGKVVLNDVQNGTELDEALLFESDHTTVETLNPWFVYQGILKAIGAGITLQSSAGADIGVGTRVFFKPCGSVNNGTTTSPLTTASTHVGLLSLSRTFDKLLDIVITRGAAGWLDLADVKNFY